MVACEFGQVVDDSGTDGNCNRFVLGEERFQFFNIGPFRIKVVIFNDVRLSLVYPFLFQNFENCLSSCFPGVLVSYDHSLFVRKQGLEHTSCLFCCFLPDFKSFCVTCFPDGFSDQFVIVHVTFLFTLLLQI